MEEQICNSLPWYFKIKGIHDERTEVEYVLENDPERNETLKCRWLENTMNIE
jgi:hypothetical protein